MAGADWVLLYIGVNVSLLLGPGMKTNKLETMWEGPEGAGPEQGQIRQAEEPDAVLTACWSTG